jgi:hypothetical protein
MDTMAHREWCLRPGEGLNINEYLRSKNGLFYAVMQSDANFVIYRGDWWETRENLSIWNLYDHSVGYPEDLHNLSRPYSASAVMQDDGNFIIFNEVHGQGVTRPGARALWSTWQGKDEGGNYELGSNAQGKDEGGNCELGSNANYWAVMQDDGDFCIKYNGIFPRFRNFIPVQMIG